MIHKEDVNRIGFFTKPHGIKGELSLVTDYDLFEDEADPFLFCEIDGILVPFFVESFRYKSNSVILVKLEHINNEMAAKRFINMDVFYPTNRVKTPLYDEHSWEQFVGYILVGKTQGELGIITNVDETTINTLLRVDFRGKELLVPIADELIHAIDETQQRIIVSLPEGILDL